MLAIKKSSKKKTIILTSIVLINVVLIGYFIIRNYLPESSSTVSSTDKKEEVAAPSISTSFDSDFITKEPFIKLRLRGAFPIEVGEMGRPNPFMSSELVPTTTDGLSPR